MLKGRPEDKEHLVKKTLSILRKLDIEHRGEAEFRFNCDVLIRG